VTITKIQNSKVTYKITALAAILLQIQNGAFFTHVTITKFQNNIKLNLGLKLLRLSTILPKIQNGAFIYIK